MRDQIEKNLSSSIDGSIVLDLLDSYQQIISKFRRGDISACLSESGKFVENVFRAIEFLRSGTALSEIKHVGSTRSAIEKDATLPESLRLLIPRVATGMIYDIRSKRGAVHVKEIDPRTIDASLAVHASSWIVAEFIRLYHVDSEDEVKNEMASLVRAYIPYVESFGDDVVVTRDVSCELELLLLLLESGSNGLTRRDLGVHCKFTPSSVSKTIKKLEKSRFTHQARSGTYHITGPGEQRITDLIAEK